MPQGHLGVALILFERDRHQQFLGPISRQSIMRGRDLITFLIRERICPNNSLRLDDFAIDARAPKILALGRSHAEEISASHPKVYFAGWRGELFRPPPAHQMLRISPCLPDQFARRVEDASDDEFTLR